jgi:fatty acid synthase
MKYMSGSNLNYIAVNGDSKNLLTGIGKLYEYGFNPQIKELYPKVQFPVPRGTPFISPLIKWDHSKKW